MKEFLSSACPKTLMSDKKASFSRLVKQGNMKISCIILISILWGVVQAQNNGSETSGNPFITHDRGADPSAQVWVDGKVWVYASHDQDDATGYGSMDGYRVYSSYDLVNWTDHGEILHSRDVSWGTPDGGKMFAPDAAYKNGKYYLYFPHPNEGWSFKIGVAISDKPEGPFIDIGNYIEGTDGIDPTCFIDDDGTAYLMWGGDHQQPRIARLKDNMIELAEEPRIIDYGRNDEEEFFEAGYIHKYKDKYYFSYNCNTCWPNTGQYAIGDHPYGPYEYKGVVSEVPDGAQIHNSMIEYHGQWYYFYHMGNYNDGSMYRRNLCVDSMFYNPDGTIQKVIHTTTGVGADPIGSTKGHLVPGKFEAEKYYSTSGIDSVSINDTTLLANINSGDTVSYVLDILGSEEYDMNIKVKDVVIGSVIYCLVDDNPSDTIIIEKAVDTIKHSIFLHKGKHTFTLQFENTSPTADLLKINWIELDGDITYFPIIASAGEGGTIYPEGTVYVQEGDSLILTLDWMIGYKPDSLVIDDAKQAPALSYTFHNITAEHTIHADFKSCEGTVLTPYVKINDEEPINTSTIEATEGSNLLMYVEYEGEGDLLWTDKSGITNNQNNYEISNLKPTHSGEYAATLTNTSGCKSQEIFDLTVNPIVLDVYQAEDYLNQSGIDSEGCSDLGNGENIGWIENGDWCTYEVKIDTAGVYDFTARVATSSNGGTIEISMDNVVLGSAKVSGDKSDGWQDWYTTNPVEVNFKETGTHTIKLSYKGGGGFLFNLNWFDLEYNRSWEPSALQNQVKEINDFLVYPNPFKDVLNINYSLHEQSSVEFKVVDMYGRVIKSLEKISHQMPGDYSLQWNGAGLPGSIYFLKGLINNRPVSKKIFLNQ